MLPFCRVVVLADAMLATPVQSLTELDLSDNQLSQVEAAAALAHAAGADWLRALRAASQGRNRVKPEAHRKSCEMY